MDFVEIGYRLGIFFVPFLFALCFHELAHGLVAKWRGDNTAEQMGRLTMNPMAHADPIGTFLLPIMIVVTGSPFFFGWAKPVPVNERNLKRPRQDMFWVALAGPMSNILLALVGMVVLGFVISTYPGAGNGSSYKAFLQSFLLINVFLAVFNLIPVHPLDGGKVIEPFLPVKWNMWLEQNQGTLNMMLLVMILLGGRLIAAPVHFFVQQLIAGSIGIAQML